MQKYTLLVLLAVSILLSLENCRKEWSASDEAYYARFTESSDTSSASYKSCLRIAFEEVVRVGLDTAKLELYESIEDSATYLFRIGPKPQTDPVKADGTMEVIFGRGLDIFIRKADCKIERKYMTH